MTQAEIIVLIITNGSTPTGNSRLRGECVLDIHDPGIRAQTSLIGEVGAAQSMSKAKLDLVHRNPPHISWNFDYNIYLD